MRWLSLALWVVSALLEALAVLVFLHPGQGLGEALPWHVVAAALHAVAVWRLMPERYRRPMHWGLAFLFGLSLCMPVLTWPGLLLTFLPGLYWPRDHSPVDWEEQPSLTLPYQAITVDARAVQRRGGLAAVLMRDDRDWRLRAVMATRYLSDRKAVPVLHVALKDPVDEVRLLAYSLLNAKERRLETGIQSLHEKGEADLAPSPMHKAFVEERIAALQLEQAELGLAEGAVRKHALEQARRHIESATAVEETAQRQFLYGRILLRLGCWHESDAALQRSEQMGFDHNKVAPYRAECAFEQGDAHGLRAQLERLSAQAREVPMLKAVLEYWS